MTEHVREYDVVALTEDLPEHGLVRGQVGTALEKWEEGIFEVEFSNHDGITYAMLALREDQLIVLHFESQAA